MRTLRELAAHTEGTDPDTSEMDEFQQIFMSPDVVRFAEEQKFFMQSVDEKTDLIGNKDKTFRVPISTGHQDITARTAGDYNKERTWTELNKLDTIDVTPAWILGGVSIAKELIETSRVDLIREAKFLLVEDIVEVMETAITEEIDTRVTTNVVYGGDATKPDDLSKGDKITTDLVADAIEKLGTKWKAHMLYISAAQQNVFHKSSQFTNAAEYGSDKVVLKGEIGEYLGVKIIVTDLVQAYAKDAQDKKITGDDGKWGHDDNTPLFTAGTSCQLIGFTRSGRKPIAFVWKEKPTVDYEYSKKYTSHYIMSDVAYKARVIHEKACCLIKVSDT